MVKIDTKEYFRVFHLSGEKLTEKMTEELGELLLQKLHEAPGHAIVVLPESADLPVALLTRLKDVQSRYAGDQLSFVITPVTGEHKRKHPILRELNHAPTLQEAVDLVMMEKIERELTAPDDEVQKDSENN